MQARRIAQMQGRIAQLIGALHFFCANVQKPHPRAVKTENDAGIGRAHDGELNQVFRFALGVCAQIEHHHVGVFKRR